MHRIVTESEKFYKLSYWISLVGNIYLITVFTNFWAFGALSEYKVLKCSLIVLNIIGVAAAKLVMVETA